MFTFDYRSQAQENAESGKLFKEVKRAVEADQLKKTLDRLRGEDNM